MNDRKQFVFTSESVGEGHPDKVCDQISDAVLDDVIRQDKNGRVACECFVTVGLTSGCGASFGRTAEERAHMYRSITRSEWDMAKDDMDHFNMMDRRSRLTRWH